MAKDYAKRKTTQSRPRKSTRGRAKAAAPVNKPWKWLLSGLLIGVLCTSGFYLYQHNPRVQRAIYALFQSKTLLESKAAAPAPKKTLAGKPPSPKFDFYTMLPNQAVNSVKSPKPLAIKPALSPVKAGASQFVLQIASFKRNHDADRLKAELTLLGFNVNVKKANASKKTWYRVWVGPYKSRYAAKSDQQRLQTNRIKSLLRQKPV